MSLTVLAEPQDDAGQPRATGGEPAVRVVRGRRRYVPVTADDWLRIAELLVGDLAATLRTALLLAVVFVGVLAAVGIAFGPQFAALGAIAGGVVFLVGRRGSVRH